MKIESYAALVDLWAEYEMGPSKSARPSDASRRSPLVGQTLAFQGHAIVEQREGFASVRADCYERHVLMIGAFHPDALDDWEDAFDAELRANPILLVPPGLPSCEAEELERIRYEVESIVGGKAA